MIYAFKLTDIPSNIFFYVIALAVIALFIVFMMYRTIDIIKGKGGKVLFVVAVNRKGRFRVRDMTDVGKRNVYFNSYVDVEAFIVRKKSGWNL